MGVSRALGLLFLSEPFFPQLQVQKEKSVAIHVIIVKTMISAKQDSAKKSLVHYTSQISVMFFLLMGQISSVLFFVLVNSSQLVFSHLLKELCKPGLQQFFMKKPKILFLTILTLHSYYIHFEITNLENLKLNIKKLKYCF